MSMGYRILDERLSQIAASAGRLRAHHGHAAAFAYTLLLQRTAYIFCLLLPFGLASTAGWATPLFTALIAYTFFGLDALSEELEDPFGTRGQRSGPGRAVPGLRNFRVRGTGRDTAENDPG